MREGIFRVSKNLTCYSPISIAPKTVVLINEIERSKSRLWPYLGVGEEWRVGAVGADAHKGVMETSGVVSGLNADGRMSIPAFPPLFSLFCD